MKSRMMMSSEGNDEEVMKWSIVTFVDFLSNEAYI